MSFEPPPFLPYIAVGDLRPTREEYRKGDAHAEFLVRKIYMTELICEAHCCGRDGEVDHEIFHHSKESIGESQVVQWSGNMYAVCSPKERRHVKETPIP